MGGPRKTHQSKIRFEMLEPRRCLSAVPDAILEEFVAPDVHVDEYVRSYHLQHTGAANAHQRWSGSQSTIVAVIDVEFDLDSPEIAHNIWINEEEIPTAIRENLIDVDQDGIITFDDINAPENLNDPVNQISNKVSCGSNASITACDLQAAWGSGVDNNSDGYADLFGLDIHENDGFPDNNQVNTGHGTAVASVIAGVADGANISGHVANMVGVAPRVRIMPIRLGPLGQVADYLEALEYVLTIDQQFAAANSHEKIAAVNVSLGVNGNWGWDAAEPDANFHEVIGVGEPGTQAAVRDTVQSLDIAEIVYVDSAGNDDINLTVTDQTDAHGEFDMFQGGGESHRYVTRWLTSPNSIVVGGTARPNQVTDAPVMDLGDYTDSNHGLSGDRDFRFYANGPIHEETWLHGVDVFAPADRIYTALQRGDAFNNEHGETGTSFAAPQVAGTVALLKSLFPDMEASVFNHSRVQIEGDVCSPVANDEFPDGRLGIVDHIFCTARQFTQGIAPDLLTGSNFGFLQVDAVLDAVIAERYDPRDLNRDGMVLSGDDIDLLYSAISYLDQNNEYSFWFDTNADGVVSHQIVDLDNDGSDDAVLGDVQHFVNVLLEIVFGDSNFDSSFDSDDLVFVFDNDEYSDGVENNSGWVEGDWNGDGEFNADDLDFVAMLGTYEE